MKRRIWTVCYGVALTAFTVYISLDTFVLRSSYQTNATQMNTAMFENEPEKTTALEETDNGTELLSSDIYQDENITVTLKEYYEYDTHIYVADVLLTSAEYLKTAFAEDTYGKNIQESGYVIRNGVVYRDNGNGNDILCLYADGRMEVVDSDEYTAEELAAQGVWQAFCFGPGLLEDGLVTVTEDQEVGKSMASNPRTAIGMITNNHYVFVVSDGRTHESEGLSLYELAQFMQTLGVQTAYNLDGGGSSTMYFNGQVVNNPTTNGKIKERGVSDIVYIGS